MKQGGHIKGTPFQSGRLFDRSANLSGYAEHKENGFALFKLNKRLKIFRGEENSWFASGRYGQLWEHSKGKLGFTVVSAKMITMAIAAGFTPLRRGDTEADFSCDWNDENLNRLIRMLKLRIRREAPAHAFESSHRN